METQKKQLARQGIALIAAMIFIVVFAAISIGFLSLSSANTQIADNHRTGNNAFNAALSGLDCARYLLVKAFNAYKSAPAYTNSKTVANTISTTEANTLWNNIYTQLCTQITMASNLGGTLNPTPTNNSTTGVGQITISGVQYQNSGKTFTIKYSHAAGDTNIYITCTGTDGVISRTAKTSVAIAKDATTLKYGVAGHGRVWLAGNTTIHGDIYSSYAKYTYNTDGSIKSISNTTANFAPFEIEANSTVEGTLNTVLTQAQVAATSDNTAELLGTYNGINYGTSATDFAGLSISDYDTSSYKSAIPTTTVSPGTVSGNSVIQNCTLSKSSATTVTEYFPHASGSYTTKSSSSSLTLKRYKYSSKTFSNVTVSAGENALFDGCTFNGVLYVNCNTSGPTYTNSSTFNNVRFNNCTFNGTIITNVPTSLTTNWWMANCLYFTGTATFQNKSGIEEATILAPNFNVNLGNTDAGKSNNNTLTGVVIGGIVDVRGNANIEGTIISMADTSSYTSGYVSNIGATLADGGSETTSIDDIGTIGITPHIDGKLPYGIKTPVVLDLSSSSSSSSSSFTAHYAEN
jgi:Tfp pilus assembly protein PilX